MTVLGQIGSVPKGDPPSNTGFERNKNGFGFSAEDYFNGGDGVPLGAPDSSGQSYGRPNF